MGIVANAQTPKTKFLQNKTILHFNSPNISLIIRQQAYDGLIKVVHPGFNNHGYVKENVLSKKQLYYGGADRVLSVPLYDILGNLIKDTLTRPSELFSSIAFDSTTNDRLFVEQFLYIKNDKLLSHVSWISPKKKIITSSGLYLENSLVFNAYYNIAETVSKRIRRKAVSLGITNRILTDSSVQADMIKQWYRQNLATALWPVLASDNADIYRIDSGKKIGISEINANLLGYAIDVPGYDAFGSLTDTKPVPALLSPAIFSKMMLIQEWYYNPSKEVVFNDIKEVILYAVKNNTTEPTPVLRIIFRH